MPGFEYSELGAGAKWVPYTARFLVRAALARKNACGKLHFDTQISFMEVCGRVEACGVLIESLVQ